MISEEQSACAPSDKHQPIRIALAIVSYFAHGGLQRDCVGLARGLAQRGLDVDVVVGRIKGDPPADLPFQVIGARGRTNHARDWDFARRLSQFVSDRGYSVVVGLDPMPGLDVYFAGQPVYRAYANLTYGSSYRLTPRYRARVSLETGVADPASNTRILALTRAIIEDFQTHYGTPASRFELIGPTLDEKFRARRDREADRRSVATEYGIDETMPICLFVGSRFRTKALDRVLRAIAHIDLQTNGTCRLLVVGDDTSRSYRRLAVRLGIENLVSFLGGRSDIARLMSASDILVHPARQEATGGVLVEAMATGLPILCSAVCGYAHLVGENDAGVVLPEPFVQAALNQTLSEMLVSPKRSEWSTNGRDYVRQSIPTGWREDAVTIVESLARSRRGAWPGPAAPGSQRS